MTTSLAPEMEQLRQLFKSGNRFMLLIWRLGLGKWLNSWPEYGGRMMVLTHVGRKTGMTRRTPLNYAIVDGEIYCLAGFGPTADWYRNVLNNREVQLWLPDGWWTGKAEDVSDSPSRLKWMREVLIASGLAAVIVGLDPKRMTDQQLDKSTSSYRLVRIHRAAPCTGPGGPGDLDWVWPLTTFVLLLSLLSRRRK